MNLEEINPTEVARKTFEIVENFVKQSPNFKGCNFIFATIRTISDKIFEISLQAYSNLKIKFPKFVKAYDLVGNEETDKKLSDFAEKLQNISDLVLHAGESKDLAAENVSAEHRKIWAEVCAL